MKSERVRESCTVRVNGETRSIAPGTSIFSLVQELVGVGSRETGVGGAPEMRGADVGYLAGGGTLEGIAVAVNGEVVARPEWARKELRDGDAVEIVRAVQGG